MKNITVSTVAVDSSVLRDVSYDAARRALRLTFSSGSIYLYRNVDATVYRDLLNAESKGHYFNEHIRNQYPFIRVTRR